MGFFEEVLLPIGIIGGMLGALVLSLFFVITTVNGYECDNFHGLTGKEVYYSRVNGCYVKSPDGRWITLTAATANSSDVTIREGK